jgi:hypothetical protein
LNGASQEKLYSSNIADPINTLQIALAPELKWQKDLIARLATDKQKINN